MDLVFQSKNKNSELILHAICWNTHMKLLSVSDTGYNNELLEHFFLINFEHKVTSKIPKSCSQSENAGYANYSS